MSNLFQLRKDVNWVFIQVFIFLTKLMNLILLIALSYYNLASRLFEILFRKNLEWRNSICERHRRGFAHYIRRWRIFERFWRQCQFSILQLRRSSNLWLSRLLCFAVVPQLSILHRFLSQLLPKYIGWIPTVRLFVLALNYYF